MLQKIHIPTAVWMAIAIGVLVVAAIKGVDKGTLAAIGTIGIGLAGALRSVADPPPPADHDPNGGAS